MDFTEPAAIDRVISYCFRFVIKTDSNSLDELNSQEMEKKGPLQSLLLLQPYDYTNRY